MFYVMVNSVVIYDGRYDILQAYLKVRVHFRLCGGGFRVYLGVVRGICGKLVKVGKGFGFDN